MSDSNKVDALVQLGASTPRGLADSSTHTLSLLQYVVDGLSSAEGGDISLHCCECMPQIAQTLDTIWPTAVSNVTSPSWRAVAIEICNLISCFVHGSPFCRDHLVRSRVETATMFDILVQGCTTVDCAAVAAAAGGALCLFHPLPPATASTTALYIAAAHGCLRFSESYTRPDTSFTEEEKLAELSVQCAAEQGVWLLDRTFRRMLSAVAQPAQGNKGARGRQAAASALFRQVMESADESTPWRMWPVRLLRLVLHTDIAVGRDTLLCTPPLDGQPPQRLMDVILPYAMLAANICPGLQDALCELVQLHSGSCPSVAVLLCHMCSSSAQVVSNGLALISFLVKLLGAAVLKPAAPTDCTLAAAWTSVSRTTGRVHAEAVRAVYVPLAMMQAEAVVKKLWTKATGQPTLLELLLSVALTCPAVMTSGVPGAQLCAFACVRDAATALSGVGHTGSATSSNGTATLRAFEYLLQFVRTLYDTHAAETSPDGVCILPPPGLSAVAVRGQAVYTLLYIIECARTNKGESSPTNSAVYAGLDLLVHMAGQEAKQLVHAAATAAPQHGTGAGTSVSVGVDGADAVLELILWHFSLPCHKNVPLLSADDAVQFGLAGPTRAAAALSPLSTVDSTMEPWSTPFHAALCHGFPMAGELGQKYAKADSCLAGLPLFASPVGSNRGSALSYMCSVLGAVEVAQTSDSAMIQAVQALTRSTWQKCLDSLYNLFEHHRADQDVRTRLIELVERGTEPYRRMLSAQVASLVAYALFLNTVSGVGTSASARSIAGLALSAPVQEPQVQPIALQQPGVETDVIQDDTDGQSSPIALSLPVPTAPTPLDAPVDAVNSAAGPVQPSVSEQAPDEARGQEAQGARSSQAAAQGNESADSDLILAAIAATGAAVSRPGILAGKAHSGRHGQVAGLERANLAMGQGAGAAPLPSAHTGAGAGASALQTATEAAAVGAQEAVAAAAGKKRRYAALVESQSSADEEPS